MATVAQSITASAMVAVSRPTALLSPPVLTRSVLDATLPARAIAPRLVVVRTGSLFMSTMVLLPIEGDIDY